MDEPKQIEHMSHGWGGWWGIGGRMNSHVEDLIEQEERDDGTIVGDTESRDG